MDKPINRDILTAQMRALRKLAEEWRARAAETGDPHYVDLMTRTASELEAQAEALEEEAAPASERATRRR